jgi:prepilin-type N-terminal cleavage/methylation domain-containing protein
MRGGSKGLTLVEILVTLGVIAVALSIAALNLRPLGNDLQNATTEVASNLKQLRAKAMATTSAYRLVYRSATTLEAQWAKTCSATSWTTDARLKVELREGVRFTTPSQSTTSGTSLVCFNSRGQSTQSLSLTLQDEKSRSRQVQVFLGGGVVVQ